MIGTVDVDGMLARMPSRLFDEWKAYSTLDPFGTNSTFYAAAQIAAAIYNTNRRKGSRAISPREIVPDFVKSAKDRHIPKRQTTQEQIAAVERLNIHFGGADLREVVNGTT